MKYERGRYRAEAVAVRNLPTLEIIFWSKEEIFVVDETRRVRYIFHRWFNPRYGDWHNFRKRLWQKKTVDLPWIFQAASECEVNYTTSYSRIDFKNVKVRFI